MKGSVYRLVYFSIVEMHSACSWLNKKNKGKQKKLGVIPEPETTIDLK